MDIQQKLDLILENQTKMQNDIYHLKSILLRNQRNNMQSSSSSTSDENTGYYNSDRDSEDDSEDGIVISPNLIEAWRERERGREKDRKREREGESRETNIKYLNKNDQGQSLAWAPPKEPGLHNSKPILHNESK